MDPIIIKEYESLEGDKSSENPMTCDLSVRDTTDS